MVDNGDYFFYLLLRGDSVYDWKNKVILNSFLLHCPANKEYFYLLSVALSSTLFIGFFSIYYLRELTVSGGIYFIEKVLSRY